MVMVTSHWVPKDTSMVTLNAGLRGIILGLEAFHPVPRFLEETLTGR